MKQAIYFTRKVIFSLFNNPEFLFQRDFKRICVSPKIPILGSFENRRQETKHGQENVLKWSVGVNQLKLLSRDFNEDLNIITGANGSGLKLTVLKLAVVSH